MEFGKKLVDLKLLWGSPKVVLFGGEIKTKFTGFTDIFQKSIGVSNFKLTCLIVNYFIV